MKRTIKITVKVLAILLFGYICVLSGFEAAPKVNTPQIAAAGGTITQDPTLAADARDLGIDASLVNLSYSTTLSTDTGMKDTEAEFAAPNTIKVMPGLDKHTEYVAIAHEFLHYKWTMKTAADKLAAHTVFADAYANNAYLQTRLQPYIDSGCTGECEDNELNSYTCTELPPYVLSAGFNQYCDAYIPNRETIIF